MVEILDICIPVLDLKHQNPISIASKSPLKPLTLVVVLQAQDHLLF